MDTFENRGLVGRLGGEEFGVVLAGEQNMGAQVVFDVFRKRVESLPVVCQGQTFSLSVSIGVNTAAGNNLEETLKVADELLYKAKEAGRNQVCVA
jgi:diguanylate cyclase (GGDEF)-like protein